MLKRERHHRLIDGGKLPPKTQQEIQDMLNQKYVFDSFNILIYAQNNILKLASETDTAITHEENREQLYKLYEYALNLEPKPDRDELTFSQQQLVNRARTFVTMKMKRRQNLRESKKEAKNIIKMKKIMSDQLSKEHEIIFKAIKAEEQKLASNEANGGDKETPSKQFITRSEKKKMDEQNIENGKMVTSDKPVE